MWIQLSHLGCRPQRAQAQRAARLQSSTPGGRCRWRGAPAPAAAGPMKGAIPACAAPWCRITACTEIAFARLHLLLEISSKCMFRACEFGTSNTCSCVCIAERSVGGPRSNCRTAPCSAQSQLHRDAKKFVQHCTTQRAAAALESMMSLSMHSLRVCQSPVRLMAYRPDHTPGGRQPRTRRRRRRNCIARSAAAAAAATTAAAAFMGHCNASCLSDTGWAPGAGQLGGAAAA